MRVSAPWLTRVALGLAALAAVPVVAIFVRGLASGAGATWAHLATTVLPALLGNTLALVVTVGAGVGAGGTATGWLVARRAFPGSRLFSWALMLPLAMPSYVMAYAYTDALQYAGPLQSALRAAFGLAHGDYWFPDVRSLPGAATMFVFTLYPYVFVLARTAFAECPPALVEAARTLGSSRAAAFWRVELPLARPAVAGGVALALMETLADFGTVAYFAVDTFTTGIYRAWFSLGDPVAAAQLAGALLAFVFAVVALEHASRGSARTYGGPRGKSRIASHARQLTGARAWLATIVCAIPVAVGFVVPALLLVRLIVNEADVALTPRFAAWAWNSFRVAIVAALLAIACAVLVAYAVRLRGTVAVRLASRVLALGYAVPGTVLAVGVLLPLSAIDHGWIALARHWLDASPGLVLTGTVFALIYAYLVRYFAVAWNGIEPGFARLTPAMDSAARSLGEGAWGTLVRVHAPLLRRSAAAAWLLVFVDVMKELPATLVLRPFNFDTLATQTYLLAKDERLAEAAVPSLAIVAVGLVPIIALARVVRRPHAPAASGVVAAAAPGGRAA